MEAIKPIFENERMKTYRKGDELLILYPKQKKGDYFAPTDCETSFEKFMDEVEQDHCLDGYKFYGDLYPKDFAAFFEKQLNLGLVDLEKFEQNANSEKLVHPLHKVLWDFLTKSDLTEDYKKYYMEWSKNLLSDLEKDSYEDLKNISFKCSTEQVAYNTKLTRVLFTDFANVVVHNFGKCVSVGILRKNRKDIKPLLKIFKKYRFKLQLSYVDLKTLHEARRKISKNNFEAIKIIEKFDQMEIDDFGEKLQSEIVEVIEDSLPLSIQ